MKIQVKVIPRSSVVLVEQIAPTEFKVKLKAAPVDGKANQELIKALADYFDLNKKSVRIIKGQVSKSKLVEICFKPFTKTNFLV